MVTEEGYFGFLFGRRKWRMMRLRESSEWEAVWAVLVREMYVLLSSGCFAEEDADRHLRFWKRDHNVSMLTCASQPYCYMMKQLWREEPAHTEAGEVLYHCEMSYINLWHCRAMVVDKDPVQLNVVPAAPLVVMRFVWDWDAEVLRQERWLFDKGWSCKIVHELSKADLLALPAEEMPQLTYDQLVDRMEERGADYLDEDAQLASAEQETRTHLAQFEAMHAAAYVAAARDKLRVLREQRIALEGRRRMVFYRMADLNLLEDEDKEEARGGEEERGQEEETVAEEKKDGTLH